MGLWTKETVTASWSQAHFNFFFTELGTGPGEGQKLACFYAKECLRFSRPPRLRGEFST